MVVGAVAFPGVAAEAVVVAAVAVAAAGEVEGGIFLGARVSPDRGNPRARPKCKYGAPSRARPTNQCSSSSSSSYNTTTMTTKKQTQPRLRPWQRKLCVSLLFCCLVGVVCLHSRIQIYISFHDD